MSQTQMSPETAKAWNAWAKSIVDREVRILRDAAAEVIGKLTKETRDLITVQAERINELEGKIALLREGQASGGKDA